MEYLYKVGMNVQKIELYLIYFHYLAVNYYKNIYKITYNKIKFINSLFNKNKIILKKNVFFYDFFMVYKNIL